MEKAFTTSCLSDSKLRKTFNLAKDEATVDAQGCDYTPFSKTHTLNRMRDGGINHIGVGFCVACLSKMGNAKASSRGTGSKYRSHVFFLCRKHSK